MSSSFQNFRLAAPLQRAIADAGFTTPTPIQADAIPPALEGRDVLGCAMTGSGKTAAFVLPILERLLATASATATAKAAPPRPAAPGAGAPARGGHRPAGTTRALVIAPTRELAAQIVEVFRELGRHTGIEAAAVFGGVGMEPQERALRRGVDVIVACPGRLLDHMQYPYARLAGVEVLVLDEADRMLDMGFLPDIRRILAQIPKPQQTLLFSATLPAEVRDLAQGLLRNPVLFNVERRSAPAHGVDQSVFPVRADGKPALLLELLRSNAIGNAIVFTRTKHRANRLADYLVKQGIACDRVHGNRSQAQRTDALAGFKNGRHRVLVATDVAARGIDVEALSHVINFDVPKVPEDYIHRVGRTARAGATGEAFTFVSPEENGELRAIERAVGKPLPRRTVPGFDYEGKPQERFEVPIGERIAEIRARKAADRARAQAKAQAKAERERRAGHAGAGSHRPGATPAAGRRASAGPGHHPHASGSRQHPAAPGRGHRPDAGGDHPSRHLPPQPGNHAAGSPPGHAQEPGQPRGERHPAAPPVAPRRAGARPGRDTHRGYGSRWR